MTYTDADTFLDEFGYSAPADVIQENQLKVIIRHCGLKQRLTATNQTEFATSTLITNHLMSSWRIYHFHDTSRSAPIKKTANLHDNRYLRVDGSNLAAFLYLLREKHEDSYRFLRNTVRLVAPFFDDFVLEPLALNEDTIRPRMEACRHRRLLRCIFALGRHAALHRARGSVAAAEGTAPVGHPAGRAGAWAAPVSDHDAGIHDKDRLG